MSELERPYFPESVNHIIRAIGGGAGGGTEHAELLGVSTDEKPTNVPVYSLFLELDTEKFYYYAGEDGWAELGKPAGGNYILRSASKTGTLEMDGGYLFSWTADELNAEATYALLTAADDGQSPSLIITCPELNMDAVSIPFDRNFVWISSNAEITLDTGAQTFEAWIEAGELSDETLTGTFDISFTIQVE